MNNNTLKSFILIQLLFLLQVANAFTFNEAKLQISKHDSVLAIKHRAQALLEEGEVKGSWGDPQFKIAMKNIPNETLRFNDTPMSALEFSMIQKISFSTRYSKIEKSFLALSDSKNLEAEDQKRNLLKLLWNNAINKQNLISDLKILKENLLWVNKMLVVTKKLYSNGSLSQQALLDIQIRRSELQSSINDKNFELKEVDASISYLFDKRNDHLDTQTVPWQFLEKEDKAVINDFKERSLKKKIYAKKLQLTSKKLGLIPDPVISFGYTLRSNMDNKGDFVGASIVFSLPFSTKKYFSLYQSVEEKTQAEKALANYRNRRSSLVIKLNWNVEKIEKDLNILNTESIIFAQSLRTITAKSYSLGNATYFELLKSELKLQELLLRRNKLQANLKLKQIELKYIRGEKLYE